MLSFNTNINFLKNRVLIRKLSVFFGGFRIEIGDWSGKILMGFIDLFFGNPNFSWKIMRVFLDILKTLKHFPGNSNSFQILWFFLKLQFSPEYHKNFPGYFENSSKFSRNLTFLQKIHQFPWIFFFLKFHQKLNISGIFFKISWKLRIV